MERLSVVIITYNEERNIRRCLESVAGLADEIIIVDSNSTDKTEMISAEFNAIFIKQSFLGHIQQKNLALSKASNNMVLSLDADEAVDEILYKSIQAVKQAGFPEDGYTMNRCSSYGGKWIRHGSWYPDRKLRLINRNKCRWGGTNPHDKIETDPGFVLKHLKGDLLHYSFANFDEHIAQLNKFTTIQAEAMYREGKRTSVANLWVNPFFAFVSGYFIKGGIRDGWIGLMIAVTVSYQTFAKYAKLRRLQEAGN